MKLFHTFHSQDELLEYIGKFPPEEQALMLTGMGLTWNLIVYINDKSRKGTGKDCGSPPEVPDA